MTTSKYEGIGFDSNDPMFQTMSILGNFEEMMIQFIAQMEALLEARALVSQEQKHDDF